MAKKKKKSTKLPKRIAGVKVPKQLREPGGKLVEALKNPVVAEVAAAALVTAAATLRDSGAVRGPAVRAPAAAGGKPSGATLLGNLLVAKAAEGMRKLASEGAERRQSGADADNQHSRSS